MVWYGMVWYGMVWYGMVWFGLVWFGQHKYLAGYYSKLALSLAQLQSQLVLYVLLNITPAPHRVKASIQKVQLLEDSIHKV